MTRAEIRRQLRDNVVAILSLVIASAALGYNTWRNERTEQNRSVRIAAFEMLKTLGEIQIIVDYAHFRMDQRQGDLTQGLGKVLFVRDLAQIVPSPAPEDAEQLLTGWREQSDRLPTDNNAAERISEDIYRARRDVLEIVRQLH